MKTYLDTDDEDAIVRLIGDIQHRTDEQPDECADLWPLIAAFTPSGRSRLDALGDVDAVPVGVIRQLAIEGLIAHAGQLRYERQVRADASIAGVRQHLHQLRTSALDDGRPDDDRARAEMAAAQADAWKKGN